VRDEPLIEEPGLLRSAKKPRHAAESTYMKETASAAESAFARESWSAVESSGAKASGSAAETADARESRGAAQLTDEKESGCTAESASPREPDSRAESMMADDGIDDILRQYSDMVYKLALSQTRNKADADDVFQEVFVSYMKNTKPFAGEQHRKAWLIRVTINKSRKLLASGWFRRTVPLKETLHASARSEPDETRDVYEAVMRLPRKYRTAIHLFYYENMKIAEMSEALSIPESTVKSLLRRARRMLRNKLEGEDEHEFTFI